MSERRTGEMPAKATGLRRCKAFLEKTLFVFLSLQPGNPFSPAGHRNYIPLEIGGKLAKRIQTRTRVTRKHSGRNGSAKVSFMPVVVKSSPDATEGVIPARVDERSGSARAAIPIAVKGRKKRAAIIPVRVKTLPQSRPVVISRRNRRLEAESPASLRSAAIGIADELIEAEKNVFRLTFHYLSAMTTRVSKMLAGRPRLEEELQTMGFAQTEQTEPATLLRVA